MLLYFLGIFRTDKRTGKGVFFRSNGEKYEGEFRDGKRHGVGLSHIADDKTGQEKVTAFFPSFYFSSFSFFSFLSLRPFLSFTLSFYLFFQWNQVIM